MLFNRDVWSAMENLVQKIASFPIAGDSFGTQQYTPLTSGGQEFFLTQDSLLFAPSL